MGWTSYEATYFKKNGDIDRKAECDAYFMRDNAGHYKVLKSSMKGTVYYAAVTTLTKYIGKDENGKSMYESIPEDKQEVWAAVFLTRTEEGRYFHYKDQDETAGPCEDHCPKCILDLLSDTDHELALDWRKRCRKNIQKSNKLSKNEDTGKTYYTPIYYGTYHGKKVSFQSDQSLDQDYLTKDQLIKLNQPKTFWINPNDPKDYTDQKMGFDVQILIGVLLSLGSIRMIFVMRKLEKERIHDHKKR